MVGIVDEDDRSLGATTRPHSIGPRRVERRKRRNDYGEIRMQNQNEYTIPSPMTIVRYRNRNPEDDFQKKKKKGRKRACSRKTKTGSVCFDEEIPKRVELEHEFSLKRNATGKTVRRDA